MREGSNIPEEIIDVKEDNLEDTIQNIIFSNISPPALPYDCKYLFGPSNARVFVIKVEESDLTPHAIDGYTTVYLKEKAEKRPYRKADLDEIDWLKNRRKHYVELRQHLIARAEERFSKITPGVGDHRCFSTFYCIPKYPKRLFKTDRNLYTYINEINKDGRLGLAGPLSFSNLETAAGSVVSCRLSEGQNPFYFELNRYGMYCNVVRLSRGYESSNR